MMATSTPGQAAEPIPSPDPASIAVPAVNGPTDPRIFENGYKFYYFHNPSVSFAEAVTDFRECRAHLVVGGPARVPGFIPWDETHRRRVASPGIDLTGGLIGVTMRGVMADIIVPKIERGVRSNKLRRCMGTRGYARYAIPEATWDAINRGDERQVILMQAKLVSGPRPSAMPVTR